MIRNEQELFNVIGAENREHAKRLIYKGTSCGAWINFEEPSKRAVNPGSCKTDKWSAMLSRSVTGAIYVQTVRKDHGKILSPSKDKIPVSVLEYLWLPTRTEGLSSRERSNVILPEDTDPKQFFNSLEGKDPDPRLYNLRKRIVFEVPRRVTRQFRGGVTIGSIVEGIEASASPVELEYPFTEEDFDNAVQTIEDEVDMLWNETHGCNDCGP